MAAKPTGRVSLRKLVDRVRDREDDVAGEFPALLDGDREVWVTAVLEERVAVYYDRGGDPSDKRVANMKRLSVDPASVPTFTPRSRQQGFNRPFGKVPGAQ